MMMAEDNNTLKYFPCMEQPVRCYFSCSAQDKRLAAYRDGRVVSSIKQTPREEFILHPQGSSMVMIQNVKFNTYLRLRGSQQQNSEGTMITTTKEKTDASLWSLQKMTGNCFQITCMDNNAYLACDEDGNIITSNEQGATWLLEFQTGELCFISAATADKRLRCDLVGKLGLTENWKGWEVWRLIEAGDGHVRISAWMHHNHYLCSNPEGKVYTITRPKEDEGSKWAIQKDPAGNDGLVIQSTAYESYLCFDQESLFMNEEGGACGVWQLESAHRQTYSLACASHEKSIGPFPYVTEQKRQMDEWVLEQRGDITTLFSPSQKKYLASTSDGQVCLSLGGEEDQSNLWLLETRPSGERVLRSKQHNRLLSWRDFTDKDGILRTTPSGEDDTERETPGNQNNSGTFCGTSQEEEEEIARSVRAMLEGGENDETMTEQGVDERKKWQDKLLAWRDNRNQNGILCTLPEDECDDERELWRLEPCMPRAVSGGKIKTFAIGTTAAVATTVAMPFAVAGVVGLIGAEVGILADILAVGLTGAEAIASIGVVGTTAALCFRESGDSFNDSNHEATKERSENSFAKRPFCAWRSW